MHNYDTLFLDRDGVINLKLEGKYVRNFSEFQFIEGALHAIKKLSSVFKRIIIITNQQGIGKGIMTEADLKNLHFKMEESIKRSGGKIHHIYYCPHLEDVNCDCRKPKPGMIQQAIIDNPKIDIACSYLIGDSDSDIEAGRKMNLKTIKVTKHYTLANWNANLQSIS